MTYWVIVISHNIDRYLTYRVLIISHIIDRNLTNGVLIISHNITYWVIIYLTDRVLIISHNIDISLTYRVIVISHNLCSSTRSQCDGKMSCLWRPTVAEMNSRVRLPAGRIWPRCKNPPPPPLLPFLSFSFPPFFRSLFFLHLVHSLFIHTTISSPVSDLAGPGVQCGCRQSAPLGIIKMDIARVKCSLLLFTGCLTSQQHASVSPGRICSHNFTCCHTETEVADPTFHLTQSQYTDTGSTSPSTDPITLGAWQGSHWSADF